MDKKILYNKFYLKEIKRLNNIKFKQKISIKIKSNFNFKIKNQNDKNLN